MSLISVLLPLLALSQAQVQTVRNFPEPPEARPVSGHTVGLAVEWFGINRFMLLKPWNTETLEPSILSPVSVNAVKILRGLSSPNYKTLVRIGGNSARDMWWVPSAAGPWDALSVRTDEVDVPQLQFLNLFAELTGVYYQLCIGTRFEDPNSWYTRELLQAFKQYISDDYIHSIEIGNEPDHFTKRGLRPEGAYEYPQFLQEFRNYQSVVRELYPGTPQAGPSYAYEWRDEGHNEDWIRDTAGTARYNTVHRYDVRGCSSNPSLDELMSRPFWDTDNGQTGYEFFTDAVNVGNEFGVKVIWNEAGTASCGGVEGISDVFGSALWTVDAAFTSGFLGVDDMLLAGAPQALYGPLTFAADGVGWGIRPTYYGMLAFAIAIPGEATRVRQFSNTNAYKIWGAWDDGARVHTMTILNKARGNGPVTVTMSVPFGYTFAKRVNLENPGGIAGTNGTTIAGLYYDHVTALMQGQYVEEILDTGSGQITVTVPQESGAIILMSQQDMGNLFEAATKPLVGAGRDGSFGSGAASVSPVRCLVLVACVLLLLF